METETIKGIHLRYWVDFELAILDRFEIEFCVYIFFT